MGNLLIKASIVVIHCIVLFRYFDCVDVCKIRDDWTEARVASFLPPFAGGPSEVVSMAVFSPTQLDLCVYQKTARLVIFFGKNIFLETSGFNFAAM
jgi:hypothetical protein